MTHMRSFCLALILLAAGCAPAPPQKEAMCPCPPPKPAPETARYEARSFSDLPGWREADLEPSLRAFLGGCARLAAAKKKYDPDGLFFVHQGVGSDEWSPDGFRRLG